MNEWRSVWWVTKVVCGFLLILGVCLKYLTFSYPTFLDGLSNLARVVVVFGGSIVLYHYMLIRRENPSERKGFTIVHSGGLFSRVRHPMYFGDIVLYTGLSLLAFNALSVTVLGLGVVALVLQAKREDKALRENFPRLYGDWASSTQLLVPGIY